jgi:hypothetical protein
MFSAGMIPNIQEHLRHRNTPKRGQQRFFKATLHALRTRVDRTSPWEDQFKRLLLRLTIYSSGTMAWSDRRIP